MLLLLLLLGVLGGLLWLFATTLGIGEETGTEVPDVTGETVQAAELILIDAGFENIDITSREPHPDIPADSVISQDPSGGDMADEDTTIRLVISTGPAEAETKPVPDVVGEDYRDAERILREAGFSSRIRRQESEDVPEDEVISQRPSADTEVPVDEVDRAGRVGGAAGDHHDERATVDRPHHQPDHRPHHGAHHRTDDGAHHRPHHRADDRADHAHHRRLTGGPGRTCVVRPRRWCPGRCAAGRGPRR